MAGTGTGICCNSRATATNGIVVELDRSLVQGQDDWLVALHQDAEIAAVRRIAGQRHDGGDAVGELVLGEVLLESWVHGGESGKVES